MLQYLVFLGAAVNLTLTSLYIRDMLRGNTKPNRVSYLMWTLAPFIGTAAALADGVRWAVLPVFIAGFAPLMVLVASYANPKAYWKLEPFDYLCGACSLLALVLWAITKEPLIALIFAIIADSFALIPTLIKSWNYPETEYGLSYVGSIFSGLTAFFAIKTWNMSEYAFPIYIVAANSLLCFAIYRHKLTRMLTL